MAQDESELLFLIWSALKSGPLSGTAQSLEQEAAKHGLLPTRVDIAGNIHPVGFAEHSRVLSHVPPDALRRLLHKLLHQDKSGSSDADAQTPPVLGLTAPGKHGLLDAAEPPLPAWWRRPYSQASLPHQMLLRQTAVGRGRLGLPRSAGGAAVTGLLCRQLRHLTTARGHRLAVYCCTYDNTGRRVVTGSDDCLIKIWSAETGILLKCCRGHEAEITDFAVSADNKLLASGDVASVIRVWSLQEDTLGWPVAVLTGHTNSVASLDFHPHLPDALLSSSTDGTCRIWHARDPGVAAVVMRPSVTFGGPGGLAAGPGGGPASSAFAFGAGPGGWVGEGSRAAADGRPLADGLDGQGEAAAEERNGGEPGSAAGFSAGAGEGGRGRGEAGARAAQVAGGSRAISAAALGSGSGGGGARAAVAAGGAGGSGGGAEAYGGAGEPSAAGAATGVGGAAAAAAAAAGAAPHLYFICCSWSPDGAYIFAGGTDCTVCVWHWDLTPPPPVQPTAAAGPPAAGMEPPPGPSRAPASVQAQALPDGNPGSLTPSLQLPSPQPQHCAAGHCGGDSGGGGGGGGGYPAAALATAATAQAPAPDSLLAGRDAGAGALVLAQGGQGAQSGVAAGGTTAAGGDPGAAEGSEGSGGSAAAAAATADTQAGGPPAAMAAFGLAVGRSNSGGGGGSSGAVRLSSGGGRDSLAAVWEAREWPKPKELAKLVGHRNDIVFIEFSHEGHSVATASKDGCVKIWRHEHDRRRGRLQSSWREAMSLACPPTEEEIRKARLKRKPAPHPAINQVAWTLDDSRMVAAVTDNSIRVWDTATGAAAHTLLQHTAQAHVLEAHPTDPRLVMSGGYDGRTILWDVVAGAALRIFSTQDSFPGRGRWTDPLQLLDGHFSPDGAQLAVTDAAGQLHLYGVPVAAVAEAMARAPYDQFLATDYNALVRDVNGWVLDERTQLPPHLLPPQPLCDLTLHPYPLELQAAYAARRLTDLPRPHPVDRNHPLPPALVTHPPTLLSSVWRPDGGVVTSAGPMQQAMNRAYERHMRAMEALNRPEEPHRGGRRRQSNAGSGPAGAAAQARRPLYGAGTAGSAAITPRGVYLLIDDSNGAAPPTALYDNLIDDDDDSDRLGGGSEGDDGDNPNDPDVVMDLDVISISDDPEDGDEDDEDGDASYDSQEERAAADAAHRRRRREGERSRSGLRRLRRNDRDSAAAADGGGGAAAAAGGSGGGGGGGDAAAARALRRSNRRERGGASASAEPEQHQHQQQQRQQQQDERIRRSARLSGHKRRYGDDGAALDSSDSEEEGDEERTGDLEDGCSDLELESESESEELDDESDEDAVARRRQQRAAARRQQRLQAERERRAALRAQRERRNARRREARREERQRRHQQQQQQQLQNQRGITAAAAAARTEADEDDEMIGPGSARARVGPSTRQPGAAAVAGAEAAGVPAGAAGAVGGLEQVAKKRSHDAGGSRPRPMEAYHWLQCTSYLPDYYCPQLGEDVVYLRAAHQAFLESVNDKRAARPWEQVPELRPCEPCMISELSYEILRDGVYHTAANLKLTVDPRCGSPAAGLSFSLQLPPPSQTQSHDHREFLVPLALFKRAVNKRWRIGEECKTYQVVDGRGEWVATTILEDRLSAPQREAPQEPSLQAQQPYLHAGLWERYGVSWGDEVIYLGPWDILPAGNCWDDVVRWSNASAAAKADELELVAAAASASAAAAAAAAGGAGPSSSSSSAPWALAGSGGHPGLHIDLGGGWAEKEASAARLALERLLAEPHNYQLFFRCPPQSAMYECADGERRGVPYNAIVPLPLSLEEIEQRLDNSFYRSLAAVRHDIDTIVSNAERFNGADSAVAQRAHQLRLHFNAALLGACVDDFLLLGAGVVVRRRPRRMGTRRRRPRADLSGLWTLVAGWEEPSQEGEGAGEGATGLEGGEGEGQRAGGAAGGGRRAGWWSAGAVRGGRDLSGGFSGPRRRGGPMDAEDYGGAVGAGSAAVGGGGVEWAGARAGGAGLDGVYGSSEGVVAGGQAPAAALLPLTAAAGRQRTRRQPSQQPAAAQQMQSPAQEGRPRRERSRRPARMYGSDGGDDDQDGSDGGSGDGDGAGSEDSWRDSGGAAAARKQSDSDSDSDGRGGKRRRQQQQHSSQRRRRRPPSQPQPLRRSARARQRTKHGSDWEDSDSDGGGESDGSDGSDGGRGGRGGGGAGGVTRRATRSAAAARAAAAVADEGDADMARPAGRTSLRHLSGGPLAAAAAAAAAAVYRDAAPEMLPPSLPPSLPSASAPPMAGLGRLDREGGAAAAAAAAQFEGAGAAVETMQLPPLTSAFGPNPHMAGFHSTTGSMGGVAGGGANASAAAVAGNGGAIAVATAAAVGGNTAARLRIRLRNPDRAAGTSAPLPTTAAALAPPHPPSLPPLSSSAPTAAVLQAQSNTLQEPLPAASPPQRRLAGLYGAPGAGHGAYGSVRRLPPPPPQPEGLAVAALGSPGATGRSRRAAAVAGVARMTAAVAAARAADSSDGSDGALDDDDDDDADVGALGGGDRGRKGTSDEDDDEDDGGGGGGGGSKHRKRQAVSRQQQRSQAPPAVRHPRPARQRRQPMSAVPAGVTTSVASPTPPPFDATHGSLLHEYGYQVPVLWAGPDGEGFQQIPDTAVLAQLSSYWPPYSAGGDAAAGAAVTLGDPAGAAGVPFPPPDASLAMQPPGRWPQPAGARQWQQGDDPRQHLPAPPADQFTGDGGLQAYMGGTGGGGLGGGYGGSGQGGGVRVPASLIPLGRLPPQDGAGSGWPNGR